MTEMIRRRSKRSRWCIGRVATPRPCSGRGQGSSGRCPRCARDGVRDLELSGWTAAGFFGSIALISGVVDLHLFPGMVNFATWIGEAAAGGPFDLGEAVYGRSDGFYAYGHDPVRLAANLQHTRVYMATGTGTPTEDGESSNDVLVIDPAEMLLVKPTNDNYAQALARAGVDFRYDVHGGIHDFANFRRELRDAIKWDLFRPVDEHPTSWVNDTVATRGKLWELGYRFDAPPDRIVRFRRAGGRLSVGAAESPVTLTTEGGCVLHVATPAVIDVPDRPCARLAVSLRPRRLRTGRWTRVRAAVRPAAAGTVVRSGRRRGRANAAGVAYLRLCAPTRRGLKVTARAPDFLPTSAVVRARGRARTCRSR